MVRSEWDTRRSPPKLWASGQPGITLAVASRGPLGVLPRALGGQTTNAGGSARELSREAVGDESAVRAGVERYERARRASARSRRPTSREPSAPVSGSKPRSR